MCGKIPLLTASLTLALTANAQDEVDDFVPVYTSLFFNNLDLSVTAGTSGVGVDLATPLGERFRLRGGFSFMPHIGRTLHFGVQVGQRAEGQSEEEFSQQSQSRFDKLSGLLTGFTGYEVDNQVDMRATPTYYNFNLMVDFFPLRNDKHWHLTAGLYLGNRQIGKAVNTIEDMPSLLAVGIYNNLYDRASRGEKIATVGDNDIYLPSALGDKLLDYGRMSIHLGDYSHDVLAEEDIYYPNDQWITDENGEWQWVTTEDVMIHKGDVLYHEGEAYRMEPDQNSMAKAWAYVNRLKPYVGFGYDGRLVKNDDRWHIGFDAGVLFWGGSPSVVTHDGTDLTKDVRNVRGRVGDYVDIIKKFEVFPVVNLRITRRLF